MTHSTLRALAAMTILTTPSIGLGCLEDEERSLPTEDKVQALWLHYVADHAGRRKHADACLEEAAQLCRSSSKKPGNCLKMLVASKDLATARVVAEHNQAAPMADLLNRVCRSAFTQPVAIRVRTSTARSLPLTIHRLAQDGKSCSPETASAECTSDDTKSTVCTTPASLTVKQGAPHWEELCLRVQLENEFRDAPLVNYFQTGFEEQGENLCRFRDIVFEVPPEKPRRHVVPLNKPVGTKQYVGLGLLGAGVAAVAFGGYSFVQARAYARESDRHCNLGGDPTACDSLGLQRNDDTKRATQVGTLGVAVGAAGMLAGTLLAFDVFAGEEQAQLSQLRVSPNLVTPGFLMQGAW